MTIRETSTNCLYSQLFNPQFYQSTYFIDITIDYVSTAMHHVFLATTVNASTAKPTPTAH
ncbi:hypothetical protein PTUN_a1568 [Pseudoalteromonas tunicata]|nr:hypothetical protein PTUN_a1568 [Pseudoalteromonas tunicata]